MQQQKTNTSLKSKYLLHPYYVPGTLLALWVQCWKKTGKVLSLKNILLFTEGIDWCYSPSNIARLFSFSLSHVSYLGLFHFFNASGYNRQIFIFRCFNMIQVFFFFFLAQKFSENVWHIVFCMMIQDKEFFHVVAPPSPKVLMVFCLQIKQHTLLFPMEKGKGKVERAHLLLYQPGLKVVYH